MKKTLLTAAIIMASFVGLSANAQAVSTQAAKAVTECRANVGADDNGGECRKAKDGECRKDGKQGQKADKACKGQKADKACKSQKGDKACKGQKGNKPESCCKDKALQSLNLTDAQKEQVKALNAERKAAKEAAKAQKPEMNDEAKMAAREQAHKEYDSKLKQILTPEQYEQYTAKKAEIKTQKHKK